MAITLADSLTGSGTLTGSAVESASVPCGNWSAPANITRNSDGLRATAEPFPNDAFAQTDSPAPTQPDLFVVEADFALEVAGTARIGLSMPDSVLGNSAGCSIAVSNGTAFYFLDRPSSPSSVLAFNETASYSSAFVKRRLELNPINGQWTAYANGAVVASGASGSFASSALGRVGFVLQMRRDGGTPAQFRLRNAVIQAGSIPLPVIDGFWSAFRDAREVL